MDKLSGLTILTCIIGVLFGGLGCALVGAIARHVVRWRAPGKRRERLVFWGVFASLFVAFMAWLLCPFLAPPVNFEMEFMSPDGTQRLVLQDITHEWTYDDLGWQLRARLENASTGNHLGRMVISYCHSGFGSTSPMMLTPENVLVIWSKDGRSVLIGLAGVYGMLPEEIRVQDIDDYEIIRRFGADIPSEIGPTP